MHFYYYHKGSLLLFVQSNFCDASKFVGSHLIASLFHYFLQNIYNTCVSAILIVVWYYISKVWEKLKKRKWLIHTTAAICKSASSNSENALSSVMFIASKYSNLCFKSSKWYWLASANKSIKRSVCNVDLIAFKFFVYRYSNTISKASGLTERKLISFSCVS